MALGELKTQMADMGQHRTGRGAGVTLVYPETASPEMGPEHHSLSIHEGALGELDQAEGPQGGRLGPGRVLVASRNPAPVVHGRPLRMWVEDGQSQHSA